MWVGSAGSPHAASMRMPNPTANRARCRFMVHLLRIIPPLVAQLSARPARAGLDSATLAVRQRFGVLHGELDGERGARAEGLGESDPTARGPSPKSHDHPVTPWSSLEMPPSNVHRRPPLILPQLQVYRATGGAFVAAVATFE